MATFTVTHHQRLSNVAVVQTLENTDIAVGQSITLSGLGHGLNGTHTVFAVPTYYLVDVDEEGDYIFDSDVIIPNQLLFQDVGDDLERSAADPVGSLVWTQTCTWITAGNIEDWLGIGTATAADTAFLTQCAAAANAFAYRRRQESGYFDSLTTSPSGDVTLGTIMYGGNLYRQRGSVTDFASFDGMSGGGTNGLSPMIKQLLGVNRAVVA